MNGKKPDISIIVPAINEEKYIGNVFKGLESQTFRNFETIVVDGNSRDMTRAIAKKHARVIIEKRKGAGLSRNSGARIARGKILLFLDADTKPGTRMLEAYRNAFKDNSVAAATGPILPLEKAGLKVTLGYQIVSIAFVRLSILVGRPSVVGSNFAVRRSSFEKVNGFREDLMTYEDWDLSNRLKKLGRIIFLDDAMAYTSTRRIKAWGIFGYFRYHMLNILVYHLFKKSRSNYKQIR